MRSRSRSRRTSTSGSGPSTTAGSPQYLFARRVLEVTVEGVEEEPLVDADEDRRFLLDRVYLNPPGLSGIGTVNTRVWRAAEIPSANGHATRAGGRAGLRRAGLRRRGRRGPDPPAGDDR